MKTRLLTLAISSLVLALGCTTTPAGTDTGPAQVDMGPAEVDMGPAPVDMGTDTNPTDMGPPDTNTDTNPTTLTLTMADFTITPSATTIPAGPVLVTGINNGTHIHEAVFARTTLQPNMLPTMADGTVDESMLESPGEISETPAGSTHMALIDLPAGNYVIFCNVMDHYMRGMYTTITVTP